MKTKRKSLIATTLIILALIYFSLTTFIGVDFKGLYSAKDIKLGLDLAGGVSITYEAEGDPSSQDMADTIEKLKKRVEVYSVESEVYKEGSNRINVEIPGEQNVNKVLEELGQPGTLSFKSEEAMQVEQERQNALYQQFLKSSSEQTHKDAYEKIEQKLTDEEIQEKLNAKPIEDVITGNDVTSAEALTHQDETSGRREYNVALTLNSEGAKKFGDFTSKNIGKRLTIVYDNRIVSAPVVQAAITNGSVSITGQNSIEEAQNLATTIRIGALPLSLKEIRSNVVGAKLGQEAIHTSIIAGIIGFAIIVLIMILLYRFNGLIGSIALGFFSVLMIFLISAFQLTLTLEGIAGVILSIGMAIDANIIIFTRIKEEIGKGRELRASIDDGFKKAFSAIVDGNITTLIAAFVLLFIGSGSLAGFAQMLILGIILSMFTSLTITKILVKSLYFLGAKNIKLYGMIKPRTKIYNFLRYKFAFLSISILVMLAGIGFMVANSSNGSKILNYSLEFSGGTLTTVDLKTNMSLNEIDQNVKPIISTITNDNDVRAQKVKDSTRVVFKTRNLTLDERTAIENKFNEEYKLEKGDITSENISSTISNEMKSKARTSAIVTSLLMLVYIWFRFKNMSFGLSSVLALVHDCFIIIAFYAISRISVGNSFIAVLLTIIGYSINATIVVFDRIRENIAEYPRMPKDELVNKSLTQTLSRCIYTSLTLGVMALMLYILGVESMKDFALPLLVGIVAGTWSSVGISGALYYLISGIKKKSK